jgi:hypothetical protein
MEGKFFLFLVQCVRTRCLVLFYDNLKMEEIELTEAKYGQ